MDPKERKIHWLSWNKLCQPKAEGGLGFRNLYAFNLALLAKQAWRILKEPDSLVVTILKAKYFPNCSFMKAQIKPNCSFSWRSLCGSRVVINKGAKWIIGNGRLVSIWGDPWIPLPSSFMVFTPKPAYTSLHSVADLIDSLSRACKIDTIAALVSSIEVNLIRSIPLSIRDAKDELTWHYEANGTFSIKIAYHVARI